MAAKAQVGYNYSQYDFGLSSGINTSHTDFAKSQKGYAVSANFTYNYTPFLNYIADVQVGSLRGSDLTAILPNTTYSFNNDYTTVSFRAQLQLGELIDYSQSQFKNAFKNLYISGGVGVIYTDLKVNDGSSSVESKGSNVFIPIKIGYEFKFFNEYSEPKVKLDIGYQYNTALSDNFDGIAIAGKQDGFTQIVVGFKFALGGVTSYRKAINY